MVKTANKRILKETKETKDAKYKMTVEGDYYIRAGDRGLSKRYYKIDVIMPTLTRARNYLQNIYLPKALPKMYPDFVKLRTQEITKTVNLTDPEEEINKIEYMDEHQLNKYIEKEEIGVDPRLYHSITDLRFAVMEYLEDPDTFIKNQDLRYLSKADEIEMGPKIEELNIELLEEQARELAAKAM